MTPAESGRPETMGSSACQLFEQQLAAYLEGSEQTTVLSHARECAVCGDMFKDLQLIRAAARELPLEEPPSRVWKNLRTTLVREGLVRRPKPAWLAWLRAPNMPSRYVSATAAATVLVLGALVIVGPKFSRKHATLSTLTPMRLSADTADFTAEQMALAQTVQSMEQTFKQRETDLPPVIKSTYDKGLATLDSSIEQSLDSVRRNPRNDLARQFLMDAYAQKANILTSALEYGSN